MEARQRMSFDLYNQSSALTLPTSRRRWRFLDGRGPSPSERPDGPGAPVEEQLSATRTFPLNDAARRREQPTESYSLSPLLVCDGCDLPLQPSKTARGARVYVWLCGCRRASVDASMVERLVRDRIETDFALVADVAADALGPVCRSLFAAVRIGAGVDELTFVWRF